MIARLAILYRRPDLTREEFQTYWKNTHAPLARDIPGLRRYVQHHVIGAAARDDVQVGGEEPDGLAELWFDSVDAASEAMKTEIGERANTDCSNFIGRARTVYLQSHVVKELAEDD
jgi:uncharacterized protein (TIGR02118 family)